MSPFRRAVPLVVATLVLAASAGFSLLAQRRDAAAPVADPEPRRKAAGSVQDALLQPFPFTFAKPTTLEEVARQLGRALNAPVVVDRAAVDRLGLKPDDMVQLELEGVRLKTGLKLLLGQLDMTYKVVPEDNLLILTDETGADDPSERVLGEIKALHRDLHDLQDAVDDVRDALGIGAEGGPQMRKPTIIEEVPVVPGQPAPPQEKEKGASPPASTRSRSRPGA